MFIYVKRKRLSTDTRAESTARISVSGPYGRVDVIFLLIRYILMIFVGAVMA